MREEKSNICMEAAVQLRVNGQRLVTFMCTPFNIDEMAIGYLYSKGIIGKLEDILEIEGVSVLSGIDIKLKEEIEIKNFEGPKLILSGCGSGMGFDFENIKERRTISENTFQLAELKEKFIEMLSNAVMYKTMGGMHCAAIYNPITKDFIVREDIGRHNAVDKVIGAALMKKVDLKESSVIVTGRISSDMVIKSAGAGIPLVISRSLTSDLALSIAEELGVTLIGRASQEVPMIYYKAPSLILL